MRKNAKRLISAVVAAVSAMAMVLSVSAADYASDPVYSGTPSQNVPVSSSDVKDTVTEAVKEAVSSAVSDALKTDKTKADSDTPVVAAVEVKSTQNFKLTPSVMKELAKTDNAVLEISTPKAMISIDSSTIKKARNIDLSMKVSNSKTRTIIDMSSRKDFGCEVKITVTTCKMSSEKLAKAHVFCNGEDLGPVELDEDGNPIITVVKGGKYEIK